MRIFKISSYIFKSQASRWKSRMPPQPAATATRKATTSTAPGTTTRKTNRFATLGRCTGLGKFRIKPGGAEILGPWSLRSWDKKRPRPNPRPRWQGNSGGRNSQLLCFSFFFSADCFHASGTTKITGETASTSCNSNGLWLVYYLLPMRSCRKTTKRTIMEPPSVPRSSVSGILYSTFSDGLGGETYTL